MDKKEIEIIRNRIDDPAYMDQAIDALGESLANVLVCTPELREKFFYTKAKPAQDFGDEPRILPMKKERVTRKVRVK